MSAFDRDTTVGENGSAEIVAGWDIGGNANGGYLLALAASGLRAVAGRADPITITGHYLAPGTAGPVEMSAEVIKRGKRLTTVGGAMRRDGAPLMQLLGAFGEAGGAHEFAHAAGSPPELPPFAACRRRTQADSPVDIPMLQHVDVRMGPSPSPGELCGWFAFADGRPIDTLALLFIGDAFAPAVFDLLPEPGWVPTVEYTVQVRGVPAEGPARCRFHTRFVRHGYLEEDGEIWDSAGELVALTRQLAIIPR